jgi:amino acid permease
MRKFSLSALSNKFPAVAVRRRNSQPSTSTDQDAVGQEVGGQTYVVSETEGLRRGMSPRDLNMIAFSGSVGTGLVIGAGASLHNGKSTHKNH